MNEGYVKFKCNWIKSASIPKITVDYLNKWRDILYAKGWIGVCSDGVGFGNISIRLDEKTFLISGTATGAIKKLNENHYSMVTKYDLAKNHITCEGPVKASSESLTHALIYECSNKVNAVVHIHNIQAWKRWMHLLPTTDISIPYGTPELANEVKRLFGENRLNSENIIVMGGHPEGIISFGETLDEAGQILLDRL
jgi:L-ribulose-5-phosphate 4-epimerase